MQTKLIYVMDIQCGWCYGNSKNIQTVYNRFKDQVDFEFLNGGMWLGPQAPVGGEQISNYIKSQAPRLTQYTGMPISDAFFSLIKDNTYRLSSLEPSAAGVVVKKLAPEKAVDFAKELQRVYFALGQRPDELDTIIPLLKALDISVEQFEKEWMSEDNLEQTAKEFNRAGQLANGFPAFLIQKGEHIDVLASGYFDLATIVAKLNKLL